MEGNRVAKGCSNCKHCHITWWQLLLENLFGMGSTKSLLLKAKCDLAAETRRDSWYGTETTEYECCLAVVYSSKCRFEPKEHNQVCKASNTV
jgi:hypothetical protein